MKNEMLDNLFGSEYFTTMLQSPEEYGKLIEDKFGLSDLNITARVLKHWKDSGLLPDKEPPIFDLQDGIRAEQTDPEKGKRNKFNFFELIYLFIVQDLREFGFSLKKILKVKDILLQKKEFTSEIMDISNDELKILKKEGIDITYIKELIERKGETSSLAENTPDILRRITTLSTMIIIVLFSKADIRLVVTRDGAVTFERVNSAGQAPRTPQNSQPHIVLPIFLYLYRFLSMKKYKSFYLDFKLLDEQELLILEHVRSGKYKEITVTLSKGDAITLELTEELKIDNAKRLQEILLKGAYQDLQVITREGEIKYSKIKTKKQI